MRLALLAVACCLAGVATATAAAAKPPSAAGLEGQLVCPICKETLDQSDSPVAQRMKAFIRRRIAAGDSAQQIKSKLVAQFGPGVLASPPKHGFGLLAWLVPLAVLAGGAIVVGVLIWAWSRRRAPELESERLDPELEARVDAELARFEG